MVKPTGSEEITDLPKDFLEELHESSFSKGNWTETKLAQAITPLISLVKDQTRQLRERTSTPFSCLFRTQ